MEIIDLKKNIDFSYFLEFLGYEKDKEKSTKTISVYRKYGEKLVVRQGADCKVYYKIGSPEQGTIIDFLKNHPEYLSKAPYNLNIFEKIKIILNEYLNLPLERHEVRPVQQPHFRLTPDTYYIPSVKNINSRDFYFLQFRGISQKALQSQVFNNIGLIKKYLAYCTVELPLVKNIQSLRRSDFFYKNDIQDLPIMRQRCNKEFIDFLLNKDSIYKKECKHNNVAFPLFNKEGEIKGIDYRYVSKGKSMKQFVPGSDKNNSIGISSNIRTGIKELILCESPIDALSHYDLYRSDREDIQYVYFCGSLSKGQIETFLDYLSNLSLQVLTLGFDNDLAGQTFTTSLLCSVLTNSPVPYSYAADDKFSFVITKNKEKNSKLFRYLLQKIENLEFQENEKSFSFNFPKQKDIINAVNKQLCSAAPKKLCMDIPLAKDWNEDLNNKKKVNEKIARNSSTKAGRKSWRI